MSVLKKGFMLMVWRFQQVNSMILIVGLSLTLTFQLYPHVDDWFVSFGIPRKLDWLIMLIIFIILFGGALLCGIIYDVLLKLWIQQQVVTIERQPYAKEKMNAKEIITWRYFNIPLMKADEKILDHLGKKDKELSENIKFVDNWCSYNLKQDKTLKHDVEEIKRIMSKDHGPTLEELIG